MGLLRWLRGGEENNAAASVMSAGMAEIDGLFRPSKHKQTEHIEESKRRRIDVANGAGIDLDRGVAVLRAKRKPESAAVDVAPHEGSDGVGDQLDGDGGEQQAGDPGEHLDSARS
jgi:hypothetical protein